ncbi:hypothetical protein BGX27_005854, partial [Mortierella sp. AM989]
KKPKLSEEQSKVQLKTKNVRKNKLIRNPASRRVRRQLELENAGGPSGPSRPGEPSEPSEPSDPGNPSAPGDGGRKRNPGNLIGDVLNSNYKTVTLNVGTANGCLQRGLLNYKREDCLGVHEHILSTIRELVRINTDLIRYGCLATFNYINFAMAEHPSIDATSKDVEYRKEKLKYIANDSQYYFTSLVKVLYNADSKGKTDYFKAAKSTVALFMEMPGNDEGVLQR